jgi:hypothetical protein
MSETARHLAEVLSGSSRGHPEAEAHLRSLGWGFVADRWRSPEELAALPVCTNCDERFDPEGWRMSCWGRDGLGDGGPHVAAPDGSIEP